MEPEQEPKNLNADEQMQHIADGNYYRGVVINTFTTLERVIEQILTANFIPYGDTDKENEFGLIILDRMTFEAKRTSLVSLNNKHETSNGFVKSKNNSYPNSKLFDEIRLLQEKRNNFAHFSIMIPNKETVYVLGLAELRDKFNPHWYTETDISSLNIRIMNAVHELNQVFIKNTGALLYNVIPATL